jgi:hypothetical protein
VLHLLVNRAHASLLVARLVRAAERAGREIPVIVLSHP